MGPATLHSTGSIEIASSPSMNLGLDTNQRSHPSASAVENPAANLMGVGDFQSQAFLPSTSDQLRPLFQRPATPDRSLDFGAFCSLDGFPQYLLDTQY